MNNPYARPYYSPYPPAYAGQYYTGQMGQNPTAMNQGMGQMGGQAPMAAVNMQQAAMPQAMPPAPTPESTPFFNITDAGFIKGAVIGAAVAYLLTNETVQENAIKTSVKTWSLLQGGIEEIKERFRDAEAELHATDMSGE